MLNISNLAHEAQDMRDIKTKRNRINREALRDAIYVTLISISCPKNIKQGYCTTVAQQGLCSILGSFIHCQLSRDPLHMNGVSV